MPMTPTRRTPTGGGGLSSLTTSGAPGPLRALMTANRPDLTPTNLRNMTSSGNLGHLFAGSSAGPGGNPFDVSGTALAAPVAPTPTSPRRDVLRPPAMPMRVPEVRPPTASPRASLGMTHWGSEGDLIDPTGLRVGSAESRQRYTYPGTGSAVGSTPQEMSRLYSALGIGPQTYPTYQKGSLAGDIESVLRRSKGVEKPAPSVPPSMDERLSLLYRQLMNSPATLAGLGVGLSRGAEFGPGPSGSIAAYFPDEGTVDPQTLGDVMLIPERLKESEPIRTHELGHVRQGRFFGPMLPAASGIGTLLYGYEGSPFEGERALRMGEKEKRKVPSFRSGTLGALLTY